MSFVFRTKAADNLTAEELVNSVLEDLTGSQSDMDATLAEAGLASIGIPILVAMLNEAHPKVTLTMKEASDCETIQDLVDCVSKFLEWNESGMEGEPPCARMTSAKSSVRHR